MRLIRAERGRESLMVRFTELSNGWAWTATIDGKYSTYATKFFSGFSTEAKARENFFASIDQLMVGCYTKRGRVVVAKHMEELLIEVSQVAKNG